MTNSIIKPRERLEERETFKLTISEKQALIEASKQLGFKNRSEFIRQVLNKVIAPYL